MQLSATMLEGGKMSKLGGFGKTARILSTNGLGIIALFLCLIYGMATIVVVQGNNISDFQRDLFTWFLVIYPGLVLVVFAWLVSRHPTNLYAPTDFKDQADWMELHKAASRLASVMQKAHDMGVPKLPDGSKS
jgi:uncharacterized membrane protein